MGTSTEPGARFSNVSKRFRTQKVIAKSQTLITELFYSHIFKQTEVLFTPDVLGVYT